MFLRGWFMARSQRKNFKKKKWLLICSPRAHELFAKDFKETGIQGTYVWVDLSQSSDPIDLLETYMQQEWNEIIVEGRFQDRIVHVLYASTS